MNNLFLVLSTAALLVLGACAIDNPNQSGDLLSENPLLGGWSTPFQSPPFDLIEEKHFNPAFEEAMRLHLEEVASITENAEAPTFENTIEGLDLSGELLERVRLVFLNLNAADTSEGLQVLAKEINPRLTGHRDDILLNSTLFGRVKAVFEQKDSLDLTTEQNRLLDKKYRAFVRGGANLDAEEKDRLRELNAELAKLSTQFGENLLKDMNTVALLVEDEAELIGLPQAVRDSASALASAQGHEGAWAFNLQRTSWTPFLQLSERRDLREKLYTAYTRLGHNGGETENSGIAAHIAALRAQRAQLLGYDSHASYVLEENMAETPERVYELLDKLWIPALAKAKVERAELQGLADTLGDDLQIAMWDWWYYAEKLRAVKYDFDEEDVKPYLQLENVRQAAFDVAGKLWGITFEQRDDVQVYH
ncbi:MAG: hypothetical protein K8R59_07270, partial [Thermoanaerobaculales bacterium]|nr:hypothetical protein [Thermoanaerobaculales bacterium]